MTGSRNFEKETGCKVAREDRRLVDEMVSLMNAGGYDSLTASGDATIRLIRGGTVQELNTAPDPELLHDRSAAAKERALAHGRRQALRRFLAVGPERADVQRGRASRSRRNPGTWCSRK